MISDSERREVAAKLRKITGNDDGEVYVYDIMLALGLESGKAVYRRVVFAPRICSRRGESAPNAARLSTKSAR